MIKSIPVITCEIQDNIKFHPYFILLKFFDSLHLISRLAILTGPTSEL